MSFTIPRNIPDWGSPIGSPVKKTLLESTEESSISWDNDDEYGSPVKEQRPFIKKAINFSTDESFSDSSDLTGSDNSYGSPIKSADAKYLVNRTTKLGIQNIARPLFADEEYDKALSMAEEYMKDSSKSIMLLSGKEILQVKYSQASISSQSGDTPLNKIIESMNEKGWNSKLSSHINCVKTPEGDLVSLDNRRLYCSKQVVSKYENQTFSMPVRICMQPKDCTEVANTISYQIENNKKIFFSIVTPKLMLIANCLSIQSSSDLIKKIACLLQELNGRTISPEQIDSKLEAIGIENQGDTPLWCAYARMRVFNTQVDDKLIGYDTTRILEA